MNYSETVELEKNIKIKDRAEKICSDFRKNVNLKMSNYHGSGVFVLWSDSNNKIFVNVEGEHPVFICNFLHEDYTLTVSPSSVFKAIKDDYRGVAHLAARSRKDCQ